MLSLHMHTHARTLTRTRTHAHSHAHARTPTNARTHAHTHTRNAGLSFGKLNPGYGVIVDSGTTLMLVTSDWMTAYSKVLQALCNKVSIKL